MRRNRNRNCYSSLWMANDFGVCLVHCTARRHMVPLRRPTCVLNLNNTDNGRTGEWSCRNARFINLILHGIGTSWGWSSVSFCRQRTTFLLTIKSSFLSHFWLLDATELPRWRLPTTPCSFVLPSKWLSWYCPPDFVDLHRLCLCILFPVFPL